MKLLKVPFLCNLTTELCLAIELSGSELPVTDWAQNTNKLTHSPSCALETKASVRLLAAIELGDERNDMAAFSCQNNKIIKRN